MKYLQLQRNNNRDYITTAVQNSVINRLKSRRVPIAVTYA